MGRKGWGVVGFVELGGRAVEEGGEGGVTSSLAIVRKEENGVAAD